jgi:hypothetical protein
LWSLERHNLTGWAAGRSDRELLQGAPHTGLRLVPTRNNQRSNIQLAADFEIGRWTPERLRAVLDSIDTYHQR